MDARDVPTCFVCRRPLPSRPWRVPYFEPLRAYSSIEAGPEWQTLGQNYVEVCSPDEAALAQDRMAFARRLAATGRISEGV